MGDTKKRKSSVVQNGYSHDPMAVTWTENYSDLLDKIWVKLPKYVGSIIATVAIFTLGASINGEWIHIVVHIAKHLGYSSQEAISNNATFKWSEISLESLRLQGLLYFLLPAVFVSYAIYFIIGGFLHWYFYVRQRDRPHEWKCQPEKWLPPDLERHEIFTGSLTLFCNSAFSGILCCYIANGGYSTVYYKCDEYGWFWFFAQGIFVFLYQDYVTYWLHRTYHTPFLYKNFHKLHHKYKQPTAFSVTAIHPVEALHIQMTLCLPLFVVPVHWAPFYIVALYTYYHGIIDHSGINFKAYWWQPWQPDAIFHDNHHQYFHVNFAFNIEYWDKLHGTYRRKDRIYTEDIFYGRGKAVAEATEDELKTDITERLSENPAAYRGNKLVYKLSKTDLQTIQKDKKQN